MAVRTQSARSLLAEAGLPNRYEVVRRVAAGGMATVWCAEDVLLGRRVAIKLLADHFADDFRAVRRFQREARTAARLSAHPNIVTIFDVGMTEPPSPGAPARPFIVMEHLPCGTIADALRVGEVSREDALRWIREGAAALDFAHKHSVIHRDIKPANMLIDRSRSLHVGDFGIARVVSEDTVTKGGQLFGTAAYLAPEQARGEPATEASDRYALAVVAFELLTGERPFKGEHFAAQAHQHLEADPPPASAVNPELPTAVDAVLARGLAKSPGDRWPSSGAFAEAIGAAVHRRRRRSAAPAAAALGEPRTAVTRSARPSRGAPAPGFRRAARPESPRAAGPAVPAEPRRRVHPRAVALGALAAVLLAAGAIAAATSGGGTPSVRQTAATRSVAAGTTAAQQRRHKPAHPKRRAPARSAAPAAASTSTGASTSGASAGGATSPSAGASSPASSGGSADALEARGHQLIDAGNPGAAIPVLRQAVTAASPGSLTYAYALYDLGHALRLAGQPAAAVPILRQRLQIPNQTAVVQAELARALAALGQSPSSPSPAPAGPPAGPAGHDHGSGGGPDGNGPPGHLKRHHERG